MFFLGGFDINEKSFWCFGFGFDLGSKSFFSSTLMLFLKIFGLFWLFDSSFFRYYRWAFILLVVGKQCRIILIFFFIFISNFSIH